MIKELLLAIALGAFLGFGITGGFFALNKNKTTTVASSESISPTITQESSDVTTDEVIESASALENNSTSHQITITSPENQSVVNNSKITITGTTTPKSIIVTNTSSKDYSTTADDSGEFSQNIELDSGANLINISSIDPQDNQTESQILITYSTAKI
jgi:hypothetical protein